MSGYFDIFCAIIATGLVALKGAWCNPLMFARGVA